VIDTNNNEPTIATATQIRFVNTDGTLTDILGSGFAQGDNVQLAGTITEIKHLSSDGLNVIDDVTGLNVSLSFAAATFDPGEAGQQLYELVGAGNNT